MSHTITYLGLPPPLVHGARCKCGWRAEPQTTQQAVEDEVMKHEAFVQRIRTQLGVQRPTLRGQRDYYRQQADDESLPHRDRRLWRQLADELDGRLNDAGPAGQSHDTLPFVVAEQRRSDPT